jgi:uncharacterized protein YjdB
MTATQQACRHCGGRLLAGDRFCAHCGAVQEETPGAPTVEEGEGTPWDGVLEHLRAATQGKYEVGRVLGYGGMAAVFLAQEIKLSRRVAIKVMSPSLMLAPGMIERFRREAVTVAALNHPNIVTIYTVEETDNLQYFVMKYIAGPSLEAVIKKDGPLPISVAKVWLTQVASALGYGHRRGVVHRDVKPANILLDDEGNTIVTDFGIAKVVHAPSLTQVGATVGTPAYMSPEQCLSQEAGPTADQYSLGVVAYEMLTGEPPFTGPSLEVMQAHVQMRPRPIRVARPDCPTELQAAVNRMLAKEPEERWPTLDDCIAAIGGTPLAHDDPLRLQLAEFVGQGKSSVVAPIPGAPPVAKPVRVSAIELKPTRRTLVVGRSAKFRALVRGSDGTLLTNRTLRWTSSDPAVVAVVADGLARALVPGTATITVVCEGQTATAAVEVRAARPIAPFVRRVVAAGAALGAVGFVAWLLLRPPEPVASVTLTPGNTSVSVGSDVVLSATLQDARGRELSERRVRWASSDAAVAQVGPGGTVRGVAAGEATITATTDEGRQGRAAVTVTPTRPVVASVIVEPARAAAVVGDRASLSARVLDGTGAVLHDRRVTWSSSHPGIATVTPQGVVVARAPGTTIVTAASESKTATTQITVSAARIARVTVSPAPASVAVALSRTSLRVGDSALATATVTDARGMQTQAEDVAWFVSDTDVAQVTRGGRLLARAPGRATVTARVRGGEGSATLTVAAALTFDAVSAGGGHTCGLSPTLEVFCWGQNDRGQLGASGPASATPRTRRGTTFAAVSAGSAHTCGITSEGRIECWGSSADGRLGSGLGGDYKLVVAGGGHTCALRRDGSAVCWGNNGRGQLGDGSQESSRSPRTVTGGIKFDALVAGGEHTCGLTAAGKAYCWGSNWTGAVGSGQPPGSVKEPVAVVGGLTFRALTAGETHTCGITQAGAAYCWGGNRSGQLGDGSTSTADRDRPVPVSGIQRFSTISAGASHTCAVTTAGKAVCWGRNDAGQLGNGSTTSSSRPFAVAAETSFTAISAGGNHTCGVTVGGESLCWGGNQQGQLGDGSRTNQVRPVRTGGS